MKKAAAARGKPLHARAGSAAAPPSHALQERPASQQHKPDWDFTSSDMDKYKLSSAEQLRRQLLRISRHHDEAADEVHQKLKEMQENLAPFVEQYKADQPLRTSVDASDGVGRKGGGACARNLSPCFASRVSTGRLPDKPTEKVAANATAASAPQRTGHGFRPKTSSGMAHQDPSSADVDDDDAELDLALETEIEGFLRKNRQKSQSGGSKKPQYRLLRKAQHPGDAQRSSISSFQSQMTSSMSPDPRDTRGVGQGPGALDNFLAEWSMSDGLPSSGFRFGTPAGQQLLASGGAGEGASSSDSELSDIENAASRLQSQLTWWRQQEAHLLSATAEDSSKVVPAAAAAAGLAGTELSGRSEWLHLPQSPVPLAKSKVSSTSPGGISGGESTRAGGSSVGRQRPAMQCSTPSPCSSFPDVDSAPVPHFPAKQAHVGAGDREGGGVSEGGGRAFLQAAEGMSLSQLIAKQAAELESCLTLQQLTHSVPLPSQQPATPDRGQMERWAAASPDASLVAQTKLTAAPLARRLFDSVDVIGD